jgi:hypothetical protein
MEIPTYLLWPVLLAEVEIGEPPWTPCASCGGYLCNIHGEHACDCACPPLEEWGALGLDPYLPGAGQGRGAFPGPGAAP